MKKMRLFTKTFIYTLLLMCLIVLIAHGLLYFLLPSVYVDQKNNEVEEVAANVEKNMQYQALDNVLSLAKSYIEENGVNLTIQAGNTTYIYSSYATLPNNSIGLDSLNEMILGELSPSS